MPYVSYLCLRVCGAVPVCLCNFTANFYKFIPKSFPPFTPPQKLIGSHRTGCWPPRGLANYRLDRCLQFRHFCQWMNSPRFSLTNYNPPLLPLPSAFAGAAASRIYAADHTAFEQRVRLGCPTTAAAAAAANAANADADAADANAATAAAARGCQRGYAADRDADAAAEEGRRGRTVGVRVSAVA